MGWIRVPKRTNRRPKFPENCVTIRDNRIYIPIATMTALKLEGYRTWNLYINEEKTSLGLQFRKDDSGDRAVCTRPQRNGKPVYGLTLWIKDIVKQIHIPSGCYRISPQNDSFFVIDLRFPVKSKNDA